MTRVSTQRRWPVRDAFGSRLKSLMAERGMTDNFVIGLLLGQHYECSQPYLNRIKNGKEPVAPDLVDTICAAMRLDDATRMQMHKAAAADYGYDMGVV